MKCYSLADYVDTSGTLLLHMKLKADGTIRYSIRYYHNLDAQLVS